MRETLAGSPVQLDNNIFTLSVEAVTEIVGNAWTVGLRDPSLQLKRAVATPGSGTPDDIGTFELFIRVDASADIETSSGDGSPTSHLAFGSDIPGAFLVFEQAPFTSSQIGQAGSRVLPVLSGDSIKTLASVILAYDVFDFGFDGTVEAVTHGSCPSIEQPFTLPISLEGCEATLEVWRPGGEPIADFDRDGIPDVADNCTNVPNGPANDTFGNQTDTDGDGFGDPCDCDFNNDGKCDIADFSQFLPSFVLGTDDQGVGADMNLDGKVDIGDYGLFLPGFTIQKPGPAGTIL